MIYHESGDIDKAEKMIAREKEIFLKIRDYAIEQG